MKSLVIAEKPSVARDIARVLGCSGKGNGALEGSKYVVTWALGHLVTLADPEEYDKKYAKWDMDMLPVMPEKMQLVVIRQSAKQYNAVKTQIYRKDINEIIIATDAGREGELVARWILEKAGCRKPIKRLWISSVTDKAIRDGFQNLVDGRKYDNLYAAAVCRAEADWLVGINGTRALTCKHNAQLSCGRVQTPALALIAQREEEIKKFVPQEYYGVQVSDGKVRWTWQDRKNGSFRSFSRERIEDVYRRVREGRLTVKEIKDTEKKTYAPGLYDLTELQRDANKKFGYSAKQTLNIMQSLYEHHKVLTYPRTDSRYLTDDVAATLKDRLKAVNIGPYRQLAGKLIMQPVKTNKSFVDNQKVGDHHAIIPTEQFVQLDKMSNEERRIYDLVVRRFLCVLYPPCVYLQTALRAECAGEEFAAKGKVVKSPGWREVYEAQKDEEDSEEFLSEQTLPQMKQGQMLKIVNAQITTGRTNPPAHYTEAGLLTAMEKGGLGTVATRADIIEKLFNTFMMEKRGNEIHLTGKAKQLLQLVPAELRTPELTADWERKLLKISQGQMKRISFMNEIEAYTQEIVNEIREDSGVFRHDNLTNHKCPVCGKRMLSANGKQAKMLVCQDRECGHREVISRVTNARCPNCHKKMEMYEKNGEKTFICKCGYKEKLSAFQARREKEGAGVSKRDVQKYMRQQQKEAKEPVNNAFANALANIKLD
ncbi:MAG: DNA topoisomerase III [Eubacteriales bacterium]|nr:DNA topoisomerase III [Eubacteriales bacterium]